MGQAAQQPADAGLVAGVRQSSQEETAASTGKSQEMEKDKGVREGVPTDQKEAAQPLMRGQTHFR